MSKNKKKRKLNKKRFYSFLFFLIFLVFFCYKIFNTNIENIYISGNEALTDQDIIDIAKLKDYPKSIDNLSFNIKKELENNKYIKSAKVRKKALNKVYIEVKENYPLFYYKIDNKTVLFTGDKVSEKFTVPTVINQIPNTVYDKFLENIKKIDKTILYRMSEIKYDPNSVDDERFFILMNDGNYIYINIRRFLSLNKYIDMVKSFDNKKGILYLDSGEYFDIFDE